MKPLKKSLFTILFALATVMAYAQQGRVFQYERPSGLKGLNVFEAPKADTVEYQGELSVKVGGDFAIQYQGLSQSNDYNTPEGAGVPKLMDLSSNFTLPTANLNLDVQIEDGVRMHLRTYLSSRHHNESWVKGGYFQIDNLNFIQEGFLSGVMEVARLRFGMDEINYGDTHFRRSDNALAIYNPFVGNYIMDAFTTEPFGEVSIFKNGFIGVLGISNGRLNQSPTPGDDGFVAYGKIGYDKQINNDLRFRLTGSFYNSNEKNKRDNIYGGDRAGARYYDVMNAEGTENPFVPRFNPGFRYQTAFQFNPFIKFKGLEFFGVYEVTSNGDKDLGGSYNQYGAEGIYRFGGHEQLYVGARYNKVDGKKLDGAPKMETTRTNIGGGWFLTNNVLTKLEYVKQTYGGTALDATVFQGAEFDGIMIEAVISF